MIKPYFRHFQEKMHSHRYQETEEDGSPILGATLGSIYVQKTAMPRVEKLVVTIEERE